MHRLIEPGRDVVARGMPVVGDVGVVTGDDQEEPPDAVGELDERISGREMDLGDHAIVAPLNDKRHVRPARAVFIRGDDQPKRVGREGERALLLNAKTGVSENMHRVRSNGWRWLASAKLAYSPPGVTDCGARRVARPCPARCFALRTSQIWPRHMRRNNTTGKSAKNCPTSAQKYSAFRRRANRWVTARVSPDERADSHVTNAR